MLLLPKLLHKNLENLILLGETRGTATGECLQKAPVFTQDEISREQLRDFAARYVVRVSHTSWYAEIVNSNGRVIT